MTSDHDDREARLLYAACSRGAGTIQLCDTSEVGDMLCKLADPGVHRQPRAMHYWQ